MSDSVRRRQQSQQSHALGVKAPKYVEFLRALPLNATGKVMKDQFE
jgi:acyl-coenzyme A synthetase/AMP-(fatty) acid ligase